MINMDVDDSTDYMVDGKGNRIAIQNIRQIDLLRDDLVRKILDQAQTRSDELARFKANAMSEIQSFIDLSASEYGVAMGGRKGNLTLQSFDQKYKIVVQVSDRLSFDERLHVAKALIDECIRGWGADARPELMTLINDAFDVDKEGKVSTHRVLGLRRHDIKDPKWLRAMQAISDSVTSVGSSRYIRFYERLGNTDQYRSVSLDLAQM